MTLRVFADQFVYDEKVPLACFHRELGGAKVGEIAHSLFAGKLTADVGDIDIHLTGGGVAIAIGTHGFSFAVRGWHGGAVA